MMSPDDEHTLVRNIVDGNVNDFRILIDDYKKLISHVIFRLVVNDDDREELGQEIFIKVYENLPSFQFKSKLSTWIAKIAYNTCLNYLRKKKIPLYGHQLFDDHQRQFNGNSWEKRIDDISSESLVPDIHLEKKQVQLFLDQEIQNLPVPYRKVITFYHLDNMSLEQIGEIMELPIGTVKSHLFRARKLMKDRLLAKFTREELCL